VEGRVFFANAQRVGDRMWPLIEQTSPTVLVIDCSSIIDIEYTALKMLGEAEDKLQRSGITLWLAALNPDVFATVSRSRIGQILGRDRMFFNVESAVERYEQLNAMPKPGANIGPMIRRVI
jgi:anti-anti-sigma regulatory factor